MLRETTWIASIRIRPAGSCWKGHQCKADGRSITDMRDAGPPGIPLHPFVGDLPCQPATDNQANIVTGCVTPNPYGPVSRCRRIHGALTGQSEHIPTHGT